MTQATCAVLTILDHIPRLRSVGEGLASRLVTEPGTSVERAGIFAPVGTIPMEAWGNKTRFSIAAFRALPDLEAAVRGLFEIGFVAPQVGLAAIQSRLNELDRVPVAPAPLQPLSSAFVALSDLFGRFDMTETEVAGERVVVSHGSPWQAVGCFDLLSNDDAVGDRGISYVSRAKMLEQLCAGAWLLGANARSFAQLRAGTRVLLAYSSDRVETFELHAG